MPSTLGGVWMCALAAIACIVLPAEGFQPSVHRLYCASARPTSWSSIAARWTLSSSAAAGWGGVVAGDHRARMSATSVPIVPMPASDRKDSVSPWTRLRHVVLRSCAVLSFMIWPLFAMANSAAAACTSDTGVLERHSTLAQGAGEHETKNLCNKGIALMRGGNNMIMAAAKNDKVVDNSGVMLVMRTPAEKHRLTVMVTAAYIAVWAFFYFTHDGGEVSE